MNIRISYGGYLAQYKMWASRLFPLQLSYSGNFPLCVVLIAGLSCLPCSSFGTCMYPEPVSPPHFEMTSAPTQALKRNI